MAHTAAIRLVPRTPRSVGKPNDGRYVEGNERPVLMIVLPYLVKNNEAKSGKTKSFLAFPYGVLTLASYLGRAVSPAPRLRVLDLNLYTADQIPGAIAEALDELNPFVVGISLMFDVSYRYVADVARQVKQRDPRTLVTMGGAAVTTAWDVLLDEQVDVDALCYSEGETAMRTLLEAADPIAALDQDPWVTRASLAAGRTPTARYVESLDDLIDIDYGLVPVAAYSMKEAFSPFASYRNENDVHQFFIVTSRGCPFKCVFCAEPSLHGGNMRYASVDTIIAHVEQMVRKHGMNVLTIYDDQLLLDTARAKELFRRLAPFKLRVEMPNGVTAVFIDDEMASLMKQAGVDTVPLALESGSEYVLRNVIKKPIRLNRVPGIIRSLQRNGIFVQAFFVIGLPGERAEDREETVRFIKASGLDWSGFSLATPIRGSELYRLCKEKGYIDPNLSPLDIEVGKYIIRAPGLDPAEITRRSYEMNLDVNFVHNRSLAAGDFDTAIRCFSEVTERYENHAFAYYYLVRAHRLKGSPPRLYEPYRRAAGRLFRDDPDWRRLAERFALDLGELELEERLAGVAH